MVVHSLLTGSQSITQVPSIYDPRKELSLSAHRYSNWGHFKIRNFFTKQSVGCSFRRLECINSVEKVKGDDFVAADKETDNRAGIRKKNLAVFVSGGGSNFKSIHEGCVNRSIHGDVAVLVTNKRGKYC